MKTGSKMPSFDSASARPSSFSGSHQIDLVEGEDGAPPRRLQPIDDAPRILVDAARRVDQQHDDRRRPAAPAQAAATMARSSRRFGAKMPGVSTKMSCDGAFDGDAEDAARASSAPWA